MAAESSESGFLLAIESSCDETAAAVIDRQRRVLSNVVASQFELHTRFGGVVPEMASRAHVQNILPVIDEAIRQAGIRLADLTAIAVATTPGLVGSLLIGLTAAKTLAWSLGVPLVAIDHLQAHIYACQLALWSQSGQAAEQKVQSESIYPCVGMVVSGGHSNLYACASPVDFELLGATTDDAAGEAFDKVAKVLDLGFPGGPAIEKCAKAGRADAFAFPRTFIHEERLDFSFSGLKTAVLYAAHGIQGAKVQPPPLDDARRADLAASFQAAVVDVLIAKAVQALKKTRYSSLCVGGGVAANQAFREKLEQVAQKRGFRLHVAPRELCTDNAAMGGLGWELVEKGRLAPLDLDVSPGLIRTAVPRKS
ncbi:tRNA (adenosine(37)-N6)-threonylcarbamoyltransferase complex transferase subunit TsaD [Planctopirus hydrillae]|uniref:tRNA N6-adenosine threonylcarbamoyltransferase n=1 Tax=Planctopirus hydrillae TaxID=1841610 RepID=A0A1C3EQT2_9PLAN|nr:tRNA (adenosine(37)-N6)-threonylcarbamoyltransferase complex transferase subunit TsaD [Planctopirus hydrillae]ODA35562.1 tRNA N6-adenosine(37)-threonylcarbamoyltransferase complex transferase subunit TsaD [Planctopirus hydrillae]